MVTPRHLLVVSIFVCIYLALALSTVQADTGIYLFTQATNLRCSPASGLQIYQNQTQF